MKMDLARLLTHTLSFALLFLSQTDHLFLLLWPRDPPSHTLLLPLSLSHPSLSVCLLPLAMARSRDLSGPRGGGGC